MLPAELPGPDLTTPEPNKSPTCLDQIMLAWKETPKARRAALDALPLLQRAVHVTVVEISAEKDLPLARQRLADVSCWLTRHGIIAETLAAAALHDNAFRDDDGKQLEPVARKLGAILIVAGAHGHSRLRESAFGSVTGTLIHGDRCALLSH